MNYGVWLVHPSYFGLDDCQKDYFCSSLINVASKCEEQELVVIAQDLMYMSKVVQKLMMTRKEFMVLESRVRKGERILEFYDVANMKVGNMLFKKKTALVHVWSIKSTGRILSG